MQQNVCRVELNEFSLELDGRGLKRDVRVQAALATGYMYPVCDILGEA